MRRRSWSAPVADFYACENANLGNRPTNTASAVTATMGEIVDLARGGVASRLGHGGIWRRRDGAAPGR